MRYFILIVLFAVLQVNAADDNSTLPEWNIKQLSEDHHFDVSLICEKAPFVGTFQNCKLGVFEPESNSESKNEANPIKAKHKTQKPISNLKIIMDGGMPAHQHGLPTSPVVSKQEHNGENNYLIEGLKYSMPGEWVLNFYIDDSDAKIKDRVSFKFSID